MNSPTPSRASSSTSSEPTPPSPNDRYTAACQYCLPFDAEQPDLPVEASGIARRHALRSGLQDFSLCADHDQSIEVQPLAVGKPDIACNGIGREDQRTDGHAFDEIQQRRKASFVGFDIHARKGDAVVAAVIVHGEIDELLVAADARLLRDEGCEQHPVPAVSGHPILALLGENERPRGEHRPGPGLQQPGLNDRTMFVTVTGKKVRGELFIHRSRHPQFAACFHRSVIHFMTERSFSSGDSWIQTD